MVIATAIITSIITSFLIGRMYLNYQYLKSNAGFRQQKIIECTKELCGAHTINSQIDEDLHVKHKYALSYIVERMIRAYGINNCLSAEHHDELSVFPHFEDKDGVSGVLFFEEYIRPVMNDLNNNAFIGWFNWVPNVKRLTTLWNMCFYLEEITTNLAYLTSKNKSEKIYKLENGSLSFFDQSNYKKEIGIVRENHRKIKVLWCEWLILNKITDKN